MEGQARSKETLSSSTQPNNVNRNSCVNDQIVFKMPFTFSAPKINVPILAAPAPCGNYGIFT